MPFSSLRLGAALAVCLLAAPAMVSPVWAAEQYDISIGPAPLNDAMRPDMMGHGLIKVTLDGSSLSFDGTVTGLAAAATNARLIQGLGIGVPNATAKVADVQITPGDKSVGLSGTVKLTSAQQKALRTGKLYISIGSAKYPDGNGMLWGWVLPVHERAAEDEPQAGHWFLANIDVPKK